MHLQFFKLNEFDSPDAPGSGQKMDEVFLKKLDQARLLYGQPMQINSGYRTPTHNRQVGGSTNSSHMIGRAADVHCPDATNRFALIESLLAAGFCRIGVGNTFIHADDDPTKTQNVMWIY